MSNPKISVIIPIYNVEKYLERCIESVRNQTFTDIEIICVDDCSPDNSASIVEKHMSEDERIVFIRHEKNTGLGGARNSAIRVAKGEYLASADSDDYMQINMLESLWRASENEHYDIVMCGFNRVDELGNILSFTNQAVRTAYGNDINIFKTINPAFWNKLWRRSLFVDNQIYFPNHDYYEDMSTTPRILAKTNSVNVINERLYNYLVRSESITGSYGDKQIIDYIKGFEILHNFLKEEDLYEKYEADYNEYVKNNITYHAKGVLGADLYIEEKKQYLRNLLFLRIGFQENFARFSYLDLDEILQLHKEDSPSFISKKLKTVENQNEKNKELIAKYDSNAKNYQKNNLKLKNDIVALNQAIFQKNEKIDKLTNENKNKNKTVINLEEKLKGAENQIYEHLSVKQQIFVSLYGFFARLSLTEKQNLKLKSTPKQFFKDSKNSFVQRYSELFKIVD